MEFMLEFQSNGLIKVVQYLSLQQAVLITKKQSWFNQAHFSYQALQNMFGSK